MNSLSTYLPSLKNTNKDLTQQIKAKNRIQNIAKNKKIKKTYK